MAIPTLSMRNPGALGSKVAGSRWFEQEKKICPQSPSFYPPAKLHLQFKCTLQGLTEGLSRAVNFSVWYWGVWVDPKTTVFEVSGEGAMVSVVFGLFLFGDSFWQLRDEPLFLRLPVAPGDLCTPSRTRIFSRGLLLRDSKHSVLTLFECPSPHRRLGFPNFLGAEVLCKAQEAMSCWVPTASKRVFLTCFIRTGNLASSVKTLLLQVAFHFPKPWNQVKSIPEFI